MHRPNVNLFAKAAIGQQTINGVKTKDSVSRKAERQYSSPQDVFVFRPLLTNESALPVSPLPLADPDVYGLEGLDVGNEIGRAGKMLGSLKHGVLEPCAEFPVLPRVLDRVEALDAVEKLGCGNFHGLALA